MMVGTGLLHYDDDWCRRLDRPTSSQDPKHCSITNTRVRVQDSPLSLGQSSLSDEKGLVRSIFNMSCSQFFKGVTTVVGTIQSPRHERTFPLLLESRRQLLQIHSKGVTNDEIIRTNVQQRYTFCGVRLLRKSKVW